MRIVELSLLPRIPFLCLIMVVGLICVPTFIFAQVRDSYTHTEDWYDGKKITTETKFENGDVTIETKFVDAQGKPLREISETKKSDGETVSERASYNSKGQTAERSQSRHDVNGHATYQLFEQYEDGELRSGDSFYYDATGNLKSHRKYNPATQTYEPAPEPPPKEVSKTSAQKPPSKASADTKSGATPQPKASTYTDEPVPPVQEEQNGQSEASKKFRQNVPYGQPSQQTPPMMMPPYGYGMGGYGTGADDDMQKRDERPPVTIPPGGYDTPRPPWPGAPENLPAPPP